MTVLDRATKKQQEVLAFIQNFLVEHDYSPSYREIMTALEYKSVSTVASHVEGLITKGYLTRRENSPRSLDVVTLSSSRSSLAPVAATSATADTATSMINLVESKLAELGDEDRATVLRALSLLGYVEDAERLVGEYAAR